MKERNLNIIYLKNGDLPRCGSKAYPLEVFCRYQFYGPLVISYSSTHWPHRMCDITPSDLDVIETFNFGNSQKTKMRIPRPARKLSTDSEEIEAETDATKEEWVRLQKANGIENPEKLDFRFTDDNMVEKLKKYL